MKKKLTYYSPLYEPNHSPPRWRCGSPGCHHTLAVVVDTADGLVLEFPKGYNRLFDGLHYGTHHPFHASFYAPKAWADGCKRQVQVEQDGDVETVNFGRYHHVWHPESECPVRIKTLPVYIACRSEHAIHLVKSFRSAAPQKAARVIF